MLIFENKKMDLLDSVKIYTVNLFAFMLTLFDIDIFLTRALLVVSIIYTIVKVIALYKKDINQNNNNKQL